MRDTNTEDEFQFDSHYHSMERIVQLDFYFGSCNFFIWFLLVDSFNLDNYIRIDNIFRKISLLLVTAAVFI